MTPATRPDRFEKAVTVGADVPIIDLEDAVAPDEKDQARTTAIEHLSTSHTAPIAWALRMRGLIKPPLYADVCGSRRESADDAYE